MSAVTNVYPSMVSVPLELAVSVAPTPPVPLLYVLAGDKAAVVA